MKKFSIDMSVLQETINKLEQSIQQINALKIKIVRMNTELTGYHWSGKSARKFQENTFEWRDNFQKYLENLNKMHSTLQGQIMPRVESLDSQARSMASYVGGSAGTGSGTATVSLDWSGKTEMCRLCQNLVGKYEGYAEQLTALSNLDGQLCYSGFSIGTQISSAIGKIHEVQQMLQGLQRAMDSYQNNVEEFENVMVAQMEQLQMPEGWSNSVGSLLNRLSIACGDFNMNKILKELIRMLKGLNLNSCEYGGDPINLATGNFIYHREYLRQKGLYPLEFVMFYNSMEQQSSVLGKGWVHNYQIYLRKEQQRVVLHWSDGREETFLREENGQYSHLIGKRDTLMETSEGMVYKTDLGIKYVFDSQGKNTRVEDRNDNWLKFSYDAEGRLKEAKSISGEALFYRYGEDGLMSEVSDGTGRSVSLSYKDGCLTQVRDEENHTFQYKYDSAGNICGVTNARNIESIRNEYDAEGRVTKQFYPDGGQMRLEYDDNSRKIHVTEQNGNEIDYIHDERFRSVETVFSDGRIQYAYNDQNQKTQIIDKKGNKTTYDYDDAGNLTMVENPMGEKMEMTYNAMKLMTGIKICGEEFLRNQYDLRGNLVRRKDALGREIVVSYNKNGKPIELKQPDGSIIALRYDEHGNISSIRGPLGGETQYEYDMLGQVTATIDGNGNRTEYAYNRRGNIIAVTNAEGNTKHIYYNESGKITCVEDFDGSRLQCEYNEINKPCKVIDQEGNVTLYEYDKMWNMTCRTAANGGKTRFVYDKLNHLERVINAKGAEVQYEYDQNGNRTKVKDSDGGVVKMEYDSLNRLIALTDADGAVSHMAYNQFGQKIKTIDAMGNVRRNVYDKAGQRIGVIDARGNETTYQYNSMGKINKIIDPAGRETIYDYLPGGLLEKITYADGNYVSYTYDTNCNVKSSRNQKGYTFYYTYDSMNRIIQIESSEGQKKNYTYDLTGHVSSATDANGNTTQYFYSPAGRLIRVIDALGNCTEYNYDEMGSLSEISQYGEEKELSEACKLNEDNKNLYFIQYKRDVLGHVETTVDALGREEHYEYDDKGRMIEKQDKEGFVTKYSYTKGGQLSGIQYADGNSVKLSYNPLKQLVEISDWLGIITIEVDELGRAEKVTDQKGREVVYSRNELGQCVAMQYPGGKKVEYGYDQWRRLISLRDESGEFSYAYDENGRLSEKLFPNAMRTNYTYGITGALESLTHWDKEGLLEGIEYQYDSVGNKIEIKRQRRGLQTESGVYRYDYDALNRLVGVQKDGAMLRSYGYDTFGNRSFMEDEQTRTDYFYNEANQLMRSVNEEQVTDYSYDKRGNLVQILENNACKHIYEYDCRNHMYRAADDAGRMSVYNYNGLGQRVGQQMFEGISFTNGGLSGGAEMENPVRNIEFVLDQTRRYHNLLQQVEKKNMRQFLWDGSVIGETNKEGVHYYMLDEQGSPLRYLEAEGNIKESYVFDEFGNDLQKKKEQVQPFGYVGFYRDTVAETYFAQAREYMPQAGRFTARDIVKGVQKAPYTLNEYSYCWNRPLTFADRDGAFPSWEEITEAVETGREAVGDWLEDAATAAGEVAITATTGFFNGAEFVWENYISGEIQGKIAEGGREIVGTVREGIDKDIFFGLDISDFMAIGSMTPIGEAFLDVFSFTRTDDGVYHSDRDCWQQYFGYNDFYDYAFDTATSMKPKKYQFTIEDGTTYTIWMWKGDYLNLGAGCETGIYFGDEYHVNCATDTNLHMTLSLYDKRTGQKIFDYNPDDPQWWITGFNPKYQNWNADDLEVHGSIDFSAEPEMWETFFNKYEGTEGWCFDEENMVAYYQW